MIRSINDLQLKSRTCMVRVDFNVPQDEHGAITDDTRIVESLPTIQALINAGARVVLLSHLGRPKGKPNPKYTLKPVAERLSVLIGKSVAFAQDCIGAAAQEAVSGLHDGDIALLENLRFYAEEEANDAEFAQKLASLGDIYINDAFGTAHRAHASTAGMAAFFQDKAAGMLMLRELEYLGHAVQNPRRPLIAVLGGSKVSGKIDVITTLLPICDAILIGGGMMFTFLQAKGLETGASLVEADRLEIARELLQAPGVEHKLYLPKDTVIADAFSNDAARQTVSVDAIPRGWMGLDIGIQTIQEYTSLLLSAGTIIWNGPMGVFEMSNFAAGTHAVAQAMADATQNGTITVIGGGDSAAAIAQFGLSKAVTHVSTGGGASLEFLEGKVLPGIAALQS
jgi:phosphoglycerate kinase